MRLRVIAAFSLLSSLHSQAQPLTYVETPLERGQFRGEERVGTWEYFDRPHKLSLKIDYTQGRLLYVEPDTTDFTILENDRWVKRKLDIPCRPHGSETNLLHHYIKNFQWPSEPVLKQKTMARAWLTFDVYPDGVARNPVIQEDPGYRIGDAILELFKTAPPWWIVGIQKNDSTAVCRFSIVFSLCRGDCPDISDIEKQSKILLNLKMQARGDAPLARPFVLRGQANGLQFSPDNSRILADAPGFYVDTVTTDNSPAIIDLKNKSVKRINFAPTSGVWWISNDEVLLRYQYGPLPSLLARRRLSGVTTRTVTDSLTYSIHFTPDRSKMVFATLGKESRSVNIWVQDVATGKTELIIPPKYVQTTPIGWSDDGRFLVLEERAEDSRQRKYLIDVDTKQEIPIPLLDGEPIGWSQDGNVLYLAKFKFGEYEFLGDIFSFSIRDHLLSEVATRIKGLYQAEFNPTTGLFLLVIKGKVHTLSLQMESKPLEIFDNCRYAIWRPDGEGIAYVDQKNFDLWYWSKADNTHSQLTSGEAPPPKNKKKR